MTVQPLTVLVALPRVVADLLAGPEPPYRLVRPDAESLSEIEFWLRQAWGHVWMPAGGAAARDDAARRLRFLLWRIREKGLSDG